ncbi:hypothetical protein [Paracoccus laeviglucosivorans]|uniref:Uncharacterized protein n=1 Tax=Paracoccus laeviglucosivorans TaxID=1197861 RepID=A0A521EVA1_9RHOB|nr:hypothetical protein [Paracoccus laeviglucosivorans]SMO87030.1 hypothetical protein SAMN06265221_11555 [Paracoccus laeviglucosivorans]
MPMLFLGCVVGALCAMFAYYMDASYARIAATYVVCGTIGTFANAAMLVCFSPDITRI